MFVSSGLAGPVAVFDDVVTERLHHLREAQDLLTERTMRMLKIDNRVEAPDQVDGGFLHVGFWFLKRRSARRVTASNVGVSFPATDTRNRQAKPGSNTEPRPGVSGLRNSRLQRGCIRLFGSQESQAKFLFDLLDGSRGTIFRGHPILADLFLDRRDLIRGELLFDLAFHHLVHRN